MIPDSSLIDAAIVTRLQSDATLMAMMPDGVYFDEAPPDKRNFVIVSVEREVDEGGFDGWILDDAVYNVKAVSFGTSGTKVKDAAYRIHQLLQDHNLQAAGFSCRLLQREGRFRYPEVDDIDPSIRWQHRGGTYRVQMIPLSQ